ncbi:uncharacterized protein PHACADRAFT_192435 [Phanerochaete carnosa HHB-10118-sp]|uniref:Uncharacterized protein n=1 Tax=Phanerochaete carnosa (strain HHB-10118-sp) TaxID=650164 RepID=K5W7W1_PHACS|nr:uncharacterized protein PHACADRAFT_192435 [Phanerochaete carnosa HHB-10118-sp]EKM60038.1 hypothetical protein PHACADRAFT_192435 [Phanerochaete carnosa HHB-10118-sp]
MSQSSSAALFYLVQIMSRVCFDYTPDWQRGNPNSYIDMVKLPKGYGVEQGSTIQIYAVDPDDGNQYLIARWC